MSCQGFPECFRLGCSCDEPREWTGPVCFHCEEEIDVDAVVDCVGEKFCSTRCAVAVATYGHSEACRALACADNAPLTLPPMLCAFCEQPTKGETAHVSCREKVKRALALQDAAYGARAS